jgi:hypothetical protein
MKKTNATDAARIELLLAELRLPAMKLMWADLAARADKEVFMVLVYKKVAAVHESEPGTNSPYSDVARNVSFWG